MKLIFFRYSIILFILLVSVSIWMIFYPGLMNADSIVQYQQALSGNFNDWHPPIMSIIVYYILKMGGSIAVVTLIQIVLGFIGAFLLIKVLFFYFGFPNGHRKEIYSLLILFIIISPISAFSYYMVSFIKDTWLAICLIWVGYFSLNLQAASKIFYLKLCLIVFCMVVAILLRHNSMILLPVFFILIYHILLKSRIKFHNYWISRSAFAIIAITPLIVFLFLNKLIYSVYDVKRTHPVDQVMAMESLGAVVENSKLKNDLTYLSEHLTLDLKKHTYLEM